MVNDLSNLLRDQTIQIAAVAAQSGKVGLLGKEVIQAVELAVEEQNNAGGILGALVHMITADDEGQAQNGEVIARQICQQPGLMGVVGHYNSDVTLAAEPVYREKGVPVILPVASNPALTESGFQQVFRLTNRDDRTGSVIADYLYTEKHKQKAVVVQSGTLYGEVMARSFIQAFTAAGGKIVHQQTIPEGYTQFKELVDAFPENHDLLFYGGYFEGAGLLRAYREAGYSQLFGAGDGCWDVAHFLEPVGDFATKGEGVLILSASPEIGQVPGSEAFRDRYERQYGKILNYAVNSYDAARVLLAAVKNAALEVLKLPSALEVTATLRHLVFRGICYHHEVEWDEKGDNIGAVTALHIIKNGRYQQIAEVPQSVYS